MVPEELALAKKAEDEDPFSLPIRPSLKYVRTGAGVIGLLFGGWLFLAGQQLDLKPYHVLFLIAFGCVSLFWILSTPIKISVRQFAIEMLLFIVATLLLRVGLPEAFELGSLSHQTRAPLHGGPVWEKTEAKVNAESFSKQVSGIAKSARGVLYDPEASRLAETWFADCDRARRTFRHLDAVGRKKCENLYKGMLALEASLERVLKQSSGLGAFEKAYIEVESLDKILLSFPR